MKPANIPSLHDKIFRQSMSHPEIAQDFFHYHLPDWLKEMTTLEKLKLKPGSFVDAKFKAFYTDLLYEVPIDNQPGYLYLLAEHKSFAAKFLPLQLLEYMTQIWRQHIKEQGESEALPLVFPVTFYHGRQSPYPYSTDLLDCFSRPDLARKILHRPWQLIDVTSIPDEELKHHEKAALFELAQKYVFQNDLLPLIQDLAESGLLKQFEGNTRHHLMEVIKYVIACGETVDSRRLINTLIEAIPDERGEIMTIAQQLKDEGKLEGKLEGEQIGEQRGIKQGIEQGIEQGIKLTTRKLLAAGSDIEFVAKITDLTIEQVKAIQDDLE